MDLKSLELSRMIQKLKPEKTSMICFIICTMIIKLIQKKSSF